MRRLSVYLLLVVFVLTSFAPNDTQDWTKHQAKKWFKKREWLGGLKLQPHKSVDVQEFARQYQHNKKYWDEAFAFLKDHDLQNLAKGKYPIDGDDVSASVTETATKAFDSTQWESHRKFVDLQYVITGAEKIGVCPISKATVTKPVRTPQSLLEALQPQRAEREATPIRARAIRPRVPACRPPANA